MSEERQGEAGTPIAGAVWYLEFVEGGALQRVWIRTLPFRIGRRRGLELVLPADSVSKTHAEIYAGQSGLMLRDLNSRNGTFLNRARVEEAPLRDGDVLHFADSEFRLGRSDVLPGGSPAPPGRERPTTAAKKGPHRQGFKKGTRELRELLDERELTMAFQPIVLLSQGTVVAYEALGRGRHPKLPESPLDLLRIAEDISEEARLSRLFRKRAVELALQRPDIFSLRAKKEAATIFMNTHPIELDRPGLLESLDELREIAPSLDLALEIHEKVLMRESESYDSFLSRIKEVRQLLLERNVALAYDDFGAGRAHLLELAEAPPHYLKFDQKWVKDLDKAPAGKRRLLGSLLGLAMREFSPPIKTVAEGIETEAEKRACTEIGFTYGQGFHIARPLTIEEM